MRYRADSSISVSNIGLVIGVLLLIVCFTIPALATTPLAGERGNYRGQCRKLTKQIDHFEGSILPLAVSRGNRAWERATNEHILRLWNRRADLCPAFGAQRTMLAKAADQARRINEAIALAGRAALAYFTGGLSGGLGP